MIYFGTCVGFPDKFYRHAVPGVHGSMSEAYGYLAKKSDGQDLFSVYRGLLEAAKEINDLDALVLLHDDTEIQDPLFAQKVHKVLSDSSVWIAGVVGAKNVTSLAWWEGEGRGRAVDARNGRTVVDFGFPDGDPGEVDCIDGMLMVLSPLAVHTLYLPKEYRGFHGYPNELCFQARECGNQVVVTDIRVFHHSRGGIAGPFAEYERSNELFRKRYNIT